MNKKELKIFEEFCFNYANRFIHTVCANTGIGWSAKFAQLRYWRVISEMDEKFNIKIKPNDIKTYKIYEDIFLEVINKRIEECKAIQSEKDRKAAKNKQVKRKKQD